MADGTTQDPPEHVAPVLVRREDAVGHEHRTRSSVLGEHPQAEAVGVVVVAGAVLPAGGAAGGLDDRRHQVGLPDGVDTLDEGQDPFEAGAGVDRRPGQGRPGAVGRLVELHEDEVPELHEPVALRIAQRPAARTEGRTAIDVDLRARSARTRLAHLPEVVLVAEALDAVHRDADLVVPDLLRLFVAVVDGDPELVAVEAEHLGDELPRPRDGVGLEVVAEAEVAEHLEEHEVPLRATDVVEVVVLAAGAGALLHGHRSRVRRSLVAGEVRLERHHAGHREQDRRIVRDQAGRGNRRVPALGEEGAERSAQLVGGRGALRHGVFEPTGRPVSWSGQLRPSSGCQPGERCARSEHGRVRRARTDR